MSLAAVRSITSAALRPRGTAEAARGGPHLGRGVVTAVHDGSAELLLDDGAVVNAVFALSLPYAACRGDELLVIGEDGAHFVIGVLAGRGRTSLELQGDVAVRAVDGTLSLAGDRGLELRSPVVDVIAGDLRMTARAMVETFVTAFRRVSELLHVHAGQELSVVDEASHQQAKTTSIQCEDTVTIQGKEIHVG
ncbi:MAG TPA: DUF3540 domain-containing protein [Polyangiaceae bacterium]|jgi:hypothetical protein